MECAVLAKKQLPEAIELRHQLHRIPETAYEEFKTAAFIRDQLRRLDLPFIADVANAPTATIVHIGNPSKPCVALRADIDALPITEITGLPYSSTHPGRMHACGHDGHIATLLGVAAALKSIEKELPVCVKLFWQPAEEGGGGAKRLVDAGLLDGRIGPKASAVFGLHGWPGLPVGKVSTKPGALLAATDTFTAEIVGSGTHAAYPHMGRDPIVTACEAVLNIQQVVSRDFDPTEPVVVTVGKIHAGTATNVIPDTAIIEGTVRTLKDVHRAKAKEALQRRFAGIAAAGGCKSTFTWIDGYPPTINHPAVPIWWRASRANPWDQKTSLPPRDPPWAERISPITWKNPRLFLLRRHLPPQSAAISAPAQRSLRFHRCRVGNRHADVPGTRAPIPTTTI